MPLRIKYEIHWVCNGGVKQKALALLMRLASPLKMIQVSEQLIEMLRPRQKFAPILLKSLLRIFTFDIDALQEMIFASKRAPPLREDILLTRYVRNGRARLDSPQYYSECPHEVDASSPFAQISSQSIQRSQVFLAPCVTKTGPFQPQSNCW